MKHKSGMDWHIYLDKINPETNKLYTEEEAKIHVKSFRKNSIYYWLKHGYSPEEAEQKRMEFQHSGIFKAIEATKKVPSNTQKEYYLQRGYTEEEAVRLIHERQRTFSLEKCIKKYGEIEGYKKWQERQNKWKNSLNKKTDREKLQINRRKSTSIKQYVNKLGIRNALNVYFRQRINRGSDLQILKRTIKIIYKNDFKNINMFSEIYNNLKSRYKLYGTASLESLRVLKPIYNYCINCLKMGKNNVRLGIPGSKEICLRDGKQIYFYDFCVMDKKIIIEYNNIKWHPNPHYMSLQQFENYRYPFSDERNADSMYRHDFEKIKLANSLGYKVFVVWNFDDIDVKIKELKNIIKNEVNN